MKPNSKPIIVEINFVKEIENPLEEDIWNCGQITPKIIQNAPIVKKHYEPNKTWNREQHAGRIKFFLINHIFGPIEIDVGVPVINVYAKRILDGQHRLAAAIIKNKTFVEAFIQGQMNVYTQWKQCRK